MKIKTILSILAIATFFTSCYNDSEEGLFPGSYINNTCDTSIVTFSASIKPIIEGNCITCHSSQQPTLNNYSNISSNASAILKSIKREGASPMPPTTSLDDCSIKKFEIWINNGNPNN
jgi:archaellum component FlaG (FlaF/FlaG flagellin family)